jgi:type IV pilus assembly protein PilB
MPNTPVATGHHAWLQRAATRHYPERPALALATLPASLSDAWQLVANLAGVSSQELALVVARQFDLKLAPSGRPDRDVAGKLSREVAERFDVAPMAIEAGALLVATADPSQPEVLSHLRFAAGGRPVVLCIAAPEDVEAARMMLYAQDLADALAPAQLLDLDNPALDQSTDAEDQLVRFCRALIRQAIQQRASDIHLHPFAGGGVVRLRIDGQLVRVAAVTREVLTAAIRLFKAQGGMDSTNTMVPQDGRASLHYQRKAYDLRVSTLPASGAEALVIRILDQSRTFSLEKTNFAPWALHALKRLGASANGLVLITGPTGSGKTSTLYSLLATLNKSTRRIITVEEPVEYRLEGLTQVDVNPTAGLTFQRALRSVLRQDPDILLIGEIRDHETAEIAVQAALTGHLVFSTLHTQDAIRAIPRLVELGISPPMLADTLLGVVSQRLMRQLCPHCKAPCSEPLRPIETLFLQVTGVAPGARKVGCEQCNYTGYRGRFPVVEVLELPDAVRALLLGGHADADALSDQMPKQWHSIEHNAANWVISGLTTPDEAHDCLGLRLWTRLAQENGVTAPVAAALGQEDSAAASEAAPTVLLITGDRELAQRSVEAAQNIGHVVLTVADAQSASAALAQHHQLQLLLVDVSDAKPDRRDWAAQLRQSLAWAGLPVLALYNPEESGVVQRVEAFGVRTHMAWPAPSRGTGRAHGRNAQLSVGSGPRATPDSRAATSAWRAQPVFSSTCCNWARTVLRLTLPLAAMSSSESPVARPRATRASDGVRSKQRPQQLHRRRLARGHRRDDQQGIRAGKNVVRRAADRHDMRHHICVPLRAAHCKRLHPGLCGPVRGIQLGQGRPQDRVGARVGQRNAVLCAPVHLAGQALHQRVGVNHHTALVQDQRRQAQHGQRVAGALGVLQAQPRRDQRGAGQVRVAVH